MHVATKLRADIKAHAPYKGVNVSKSDVMECIPDSLYMFLQILYGGDSCFDDHDEEDDTTSAGDNSELVSSVAQDLVFGVSGGRKWTPKHVGLGCSLHQATRSKQLVELFHKAGHCISYKSVLQIDTSLAQATLRSLDPTSGGILPCNLVPDRFVHFTADNIDILDASLDGKDTFHATQVAAWQRGPPAKSTVLKDLRPSSKHDTLQIPDILNTLIPSDVFVGSHEPTFNGPVDNKWFCDTAETTDVEISADTKEIAFAMKRKVHTPKQGWTHYNQERSDTNPPQTTVGYLPLILAPAHELDTLNTVIQRCKFVAESLGQKYVVLTVDEALYCKLMELKWAKPEYQEFLIVRLGGLHTAMNFMKAIGKQMQSTGLLEVWTESDLQGQKTAENSMAGKGYEKSIRAHKITSQAMWQIMLPQFLECLHHEEMN